MALLSENVERFSFSHMGDFRFIPLIYSYFQTSSFRHLLMELGAVISCVLALLVIPLVTAPSYVLLSFISSILPSKRNIFTYLATILIRTAMINVYIGVRQLSLSYHTLGNISRSDQTRLACVVQQHPCERRGK